MRTIDRYSGLRRRLEAAALDTPGTLASDVRWDAATGQDVPGELATYVDKVRRHAHKVTDEDVEALKRAGYTDDQLFELTVATAVGAGLSRLDAALAALAAAEEDENAAQAS